MNIGRIWMAVWGYLLLRKQIDFDDMNVISASQDSIYLLRFGIGHIRTSDYTLDLIRLDLRQGSLELM
jgi:hypothetical protein